MKEWASITEALARGQQIAILRKGGIVEADRSGFQLRHREFLLFPTHEHQHARMLRPDAAGLVQPVEEGTIPIGTLARVTEVRQAPADARLLLHDDFIWNQEFLDQRYLYRPDLPLWLIVIRAYRLPEPVILADRASYVGCKSWVNLTDEIEISGAQPVLGDAEFARRCAALVNRLG
ncbi:MAG: DUF1802 family protein [Bryobacterales bacterium]|nr:DUF1802 family protein [Bryobacterales bacterium]